MVPLSLPYAFAGLRPHLALALAPGTRASPSPRAAVGSATGTGAVVAMRPR